MRPGCTVSGGLWRASGRYRNLLLYVPYPPILPRIIPRAIDSRGALDNTFLYGERSITARPYLQGAGRSDTAGDSGAPRAQGRRFNQHSGGAFRDPDLPAVMKHLDVLAKAGLVTRSKSGRTVTVRLRAQPMREALDWLQRYERFWSSSLDRLASYAESKETEARKRSR